MLPDYYVYVYDVVRDENRWVNKTYVERYPKLYSAVNYHGQSLKSEILPR